LSARTGAAGAEAADVTYECVSCGGIFLDKPTLDRVVADARAAAGSVHPVLGSHVPTLSSPAAPLEPVRYVKCPMCAAAMNRVNFGRRSGVIVNVCKAHGTWFDAGELARAYDFAAKGGIDEAERVERIRLADDLRARERAPAASYAAGTFGGPLDGDLTPGLGGTLLRVLRDIVG
jgi:Zn-finger nucleic acid-binding protein